MSMNIKAIVAGAVGVLACASAAQAQCGGEAYAWPAGSFDFPSGQNYRELAGGQGFIVAIRPDGSLQKFGGIDIPPAGQFLAVSAGFGHAVAIRSDRRVVAWGYNNGGQSNVPANLPDAVLVATSYTSSAIIDIYGAIHCWGWQASGQTDSPSGSFTAIDGGEWHFIALNVAGEVKCWGNTAGASVPENLGSSIAVAAGGGIVGGFVAGHSVAVMTDGLVRCWGDDGDGQCSVPSNLPPVTAVAAGGPHTVALLANGTIRAWGRNSNGQTTISAPPLTRFRTLATGEQTSFAIVESLDSDGDGIPECSDNCPATTNPDQLDCNNNGIGEACETFTDCNSNSLPDSCDIASGTSADADSNGIPDSCQPDCNLNNLPDAWEIATGRATDYNADGIPDTCQGAVMVDSTTDNLGAPSGLATREHSFTALPFAESAVTITIDLIGDLNRVTEYVDVSLNGGTPRRFFEADGNDCPATPDRAIITLTRAEFNALISPNGGTGAILVVSMTGSPGVDSSECKNAALTQFRLQYVGIQAKSGDCNGNNRLDIAETHDGTTPDCNLNTVPDSCDIARGAAQDCNLNGVPDACELATTPALDCNTNGIIDSCDLAIGGTTVDCDQNGRIDSCQVTETPGTDCNGNLRPDACDIAGATSGDIDHNGTPDECQTVTVPGQYADIQAAIDAAPASEMRIISVAAGTYAGPIAFNGKPVIVRGASAASTVIDGASGQILSVVRFNGGEPAIAALERMTVRGGITGSQPSGSNVLVGGGIFGQNSAASVHDCVIENNAAGFGGGAYFLSCTGNVTGTTFRSNNASADGGGFQANQCTMSLTDTVVENNTCNSRGAGVHLVQGGLTLTRVTVRSNYSNNLIGGVSWYAIGSETASLAMVDCSVTSNTALVTQGGIGISASSTGTPTISLRGSGVCNNLPRPNITGSWTDLGGNTICDCVGDLTLDGFVNGADLGILLASWGPCTGSCASDLNRDGVVNGADLGVLLAAWGACGG